MIQKKKCTNKTKLRVKALFAIAIMSVLVSCQTTTTLVEPQKIERPATETVNPVANQYNTNIVTTRNSYKGVDTDLTASVLRTNQSAETRLIPLLSTTVQSGDVILYNITINNTSTNRVGSVNIDVNIPQGVSFLGFGSTLPQPRFASADGVKFLHAPILASVNGVKQTLPFSNYRGLRWVVENLASGETTSVQFQAQVK